jgi:hypothetical protein
MTVSLGYRMYMASSEWKGIRKRKLQQVGYRCQGCSSDERLEVHHLSYARFGYEHLNDLQVLCHLCHAREHGRTPDVGPIAGPTVAELSKRVKIREALERKQAGVAHLVPLLEAWEDAKLELAVLDALPRRARKRIGCIDHHLGKLLEEVGA